MAKKRIEVLFCYEDEKVTQGVLQLIDEGSEIKSLIEFALQMDLDPAKVCINYVYKTARIGMTIDEPEDETEFDEEDNHRAVEALQNQTLQNVIPLNKL